MPARERLALDVGMIIAIVAAANPAVTGMGLHEWIGTALLAPALLHLVVNWDWVVRTLSRFFERLRSGSRLNLLVDTALFISLVGVTLSGFLVIPGLATSLGIQASGTWHAVHLTMSDLTVLFALAHLGLHWRWVSDVVARMFSPSSAYAGEEAVVRQPVARR